MSFKEWWKKLEYWKRGGIIGLILGFFIPGIFLALGLLNDIFLGFFYIPSIPTYILLSFIEVLFKIRYKGLHGPSLIFVLFIQTFLYLIIGIIIGYIIGKLKFKRKNV